MLQNSAYLFLAILGTGVNKISVICTRNGKNTKI
jgi:hypothetical protein